MMGESVYSVSNAAVEGKSPSLRHRICAMSFVGVSTAEFQSITLGIKNQEEREKANGNARLLVSLCFVA